MFQFVHKSVKLEFLNSLKVEFMHEKSNYFLNINCKFNKKNQH